MTFRGKCVVATGASQGIGRAVARGFAARGAEVHALDLDAEGLAETTKSTGTAGHVLDLGDRRAVHDALADIGPVDIMVHCAGGVRGQVGQPLEAVSEADWEAIFAANLSGAFWLAQAVAPGMKARSAGRIVLISSRAGLAVSLTGIQAYAASKAGQIGLTRQLAHELGPWNITVNNVAPGFVRSNPATERQWAAMGREGQQDLIRSIALRRLGSPEDIAAAVRFFADDSAGWITGQVLSVDGGC